MNSIDAIRLKIERAQELNAQFQKAIAHAPPHAVGLNWEPSWTHVKVSTSPTDAALKLNWGILAGEVIHQTRACLDHLVAALASRAAKLALDEAKGLWFPICQKPEDFRADRSVSSGFLERKVGTDEFKRVERWQPYNRGGNDLWILKGLDDLDKHRTIPVVDRRIGVSATAIAEDGITNKKLRFIEAKRMVAGEAEVPLEWSESTPPVGIMLDEVNHYFVFAETNGLCDNQSVAATLNNVIEAVQTVLIDFDPFFPFDWPR